MTLKVGITVLNDKLDVNKENGTTVRVKRLYEVLKPYDNVVLISGGYKNKTLENLVAVYVPRARYSALLPFWMLGLVNILIRNKFDLIICSSDWFGFLVCYSLSKLLGFDIVFEAHGILSEENRIFGKPRMILKFCQLLERFVISHSKLVIALSENIWAFYRRYNKSIEVVPAFVDTTYYKRYEEKRKSLRRYYGIPTGASLIGLIGPFDTIPNKYFLEFTYRNLHKFDEHIMFMLIGDCSIRKEDERLIYTGYVKDYVGHLSCLDAVLVPSKDKTSGPLNKIIESMSCSLPVFTTPKGVVGLDYAENGKNIFVFDENELVEKVNAYVFNDGLMRKVSDNARKTVERHYSKEVNGKKLLKIFRSITDDNG